VTACVVSINMGRREFNSLRARIFNIIDLITVLLS